MTDFSQFLEKLLSNPSTNTILEINGNSKQIKAFIHLTTKNYLNDGGDYYKIIFNDSSFMLIMPNDKELYYADKLIGEIEEIKDSDIGNLETIQYNNKTYKLGNKDDYQFVLQLLVGNPLEIEGECRFSDYFPDTGPKEFLSLGWLIRTGERADINCQIIDISKINLIK